LGPPTNAVTVALKSTIKEAADFVASYSRAWKETWGIVDVFYVKPSQVSKSPPSGEYLPKGSFIISGKKNFIKNAKTELAIALELIHIDINNIYIHIPPMQNDLLKIACIYLKT